MCKRFLFILTFLLISYSAFANFDHGLAAIERGDYATAYREFRAEAEQGNIFAQYNIGLMYADGLGVSKNDAEASRWFRHSAVQGFAQAQHDLGVMYANGRGVTRNDAEAIRWYRLAAEQGHSGAQNNLGVMYAKGEGIPKNMVFAYKWYSIAAAQGSEDARRNLGIAEQQMTRQQIAEAQSLAATFKPQQGKLSTSTDQSLTPPPQPQAVVSKTIRSIQHHLATLGYDPGPADGLIGPKTTSAIRAFQRDTGIKPDGVASATLEALLTAMVSDKRSRQPKVAETKLTGTGSGFFVTQHGHVLTNHHVIEGCEQIRIALPQGSFNARSIAEHEGDDLALLHVDVTPPAVASFRRSPPALGEDVSVAGYPLRGLLSGMNLTTGSISSTTGVGGDARYLQITAPVQPGNSGGPLLDSDGAVVGVVVAKLDAMAVARATGDIPQNVNFAIKSAIAQSFLSIHDIPYSESGQGNNKNRVMIGADAQRHTVLVECWQ